MWNEYQMITIEKKISLVRIFIPLLPFRRKGQTDPP